MMDVECGAPPWEAFVVAHGVSSIEVGPYGSLTLTWPWGFRVYLEPPAYASDDEHVEWTTQRLKTRMLEVWSSLIDYTEEASPNHDRFISAYWRRMARLDPETTATYARKVSRWSEANLGPVVRIAGTPENGAGRTPAETLVNHARSLSEDTGWAWTANGVRLRSNWGMVGCRLDGTFEVSFFNSFGGGEMETTSWAEVVAWLVRERQDIQVMLDRPVQSAPSRDP